MKKEKTDRLTKKQEEYYNYLVSQQSNYKDKLLIRFNNITNKFQLLKVENVNIDTMTFSTSMIDRELNTRFINALLEKNYFKEYIINNKVIGVSL
jgi:hypothetical protein|nr:MAG TPA: hypothetical protein [Caudoviricetes sp.]